MWTKDETTSKQLEIYRSPYYELYAFRTGMSREKWQGGLAMTRKEDERWRAQ